MIKQLADKRFRYLVGGRETSNRFLPPIVGTEPDCVMTASCRDHPRDTTTLEAPALKSGWATEASRQGSQESGGNEKRRKEVADASRSVAEEQLSSSSVVHLTTDGDAPLLQAKV